eukprot:scaffold222953_cov32-Tisochrysis_lutea.AAC.4
MLHTHCATLTDASLGVNRAVMLIDAPGAIDPDDGIRTNGSSHAQEKVTGISPGFEIAKDLTAVSWTGQKPKSRFSGTYVDTEGTQARTGTMKEPFSFQN